MFPSFLNAKSHVERCLLPRKPSIMTASPQKAATDALRRGIDSRGNAAPLALPLHLNTLCKTLARITLLQSAPWQRKEGTVLLLSKSVALSSRLPCEWDRPLLRPRGSLDCNSMCANREKQRVFWPEERNVLPKLKRAAVILEETKRGRRRKGKIKREEGEGGGKSEEKWGKKKRKERRKKGEGRKRKKGGKKGKGKKKKLLEAGAEILPQRRRGRRRAPPVPSGRGFAARPGRPPAAPFARSCGANGRAQLCGGRAGIGAGALLIPVEASPVLNGGGCWGGGGGMGRACLKTELCARRKYISEENRSLGGTSEPATELVERRGRAARDKEKGGHEQRKRGRAGDQLS